MNTLTKRLILKGTNPCILTLGKNSVETEWLREKSCDTLLVFSSEEQFAAVTDGRPPFDAETVVAAALGKDFHTRGQSGSFNWQKARENYRLFECSFNEPPICEAVLEVEEPRAAAQTPPAPEPFCCPCTAEIRRTEVSPFPDRFPDSEWIRHEYPSPQGRWHYLTGKIRGNNGAVLSATAVPGRYDAHPPAWMKEFSLFLTDAAQGQGYWIALSKNTLKTEDTEWNPKQ